MSKAPVLIVLLSLLAIACIVGLALFLWFEKPPAHSFEKRRPQDRRSATAFGRGTSREELVELSDKTSEFSKKMSISQYRNQTDNDLDDEAPTEEEIKSRVAPIAWESTPVVLEQILSEEKGDSIGARRIKSQADQLLLEQEVVGTAVKEVVCGETLCRSTQIHDTEEAFAFFRDNVDGPWAGGQVHGTSSKLEDGSIQSIVYFSKDGDTSAFEEAIVRMYNSPR